MNSREMIHPRYDAVIVGARVAGAAAAMLLARAGLRVLAIERSAPGSDTLSTHALMRAGVLQLHRWGVLDRIREAGTPAIRQTTFHYGAETIAVALQERDGVDALYAPRRTVLDAALAAAAREAGAAVIYRTTVTSILRDRTGRACGATLIDAEGRSHHLSAGIVIGADGVRSIVARAMRAETLREGRHAAAVIYSYWRGLPLDGTHWHYGPNVAAGAIPTNSDTTCVFVGMGSRRYEAHGPGRLDALFDESLREAAPDLAAAVARAERVRKFFPFAGLPGFHRQSRGRGWALVGDAACFKDPITAHGITDALRDAELLAHAVIKGTDAALAKYQNEHDAFAVEFLELSDEIASFDGDLDRLKLLHLRLSKLMNRECDLVRALDTRLEAAVCG